MGSGSVQFESGSKPRHETGRAFCFRACSKDALHLGRSQSAVIDRDLIDDSRRVAGERSIVANDAVAVEAMNTGVISIVRPSLGIAGVVPAYKLHEILFGKELTEFREQQSKPNPSASKKK